jgi:predicted oxidoreductase (fatty acid repression mutant protein)
MPSKISFLDAIAKRRSVYTLTDTSPIPQTRITELVHEALKFCPPTAISTLPPPFQPLFTEFPNIQDHASGMLQFVVWTALAAEGLRCNLQHYQPHITPWVREK